MCFLMFIGFKFKISFYKFENVTDAECWVPASHCHSTSFSEKGPRASLGFILNDHFMIFALNG